MQAKKAVNNSSSIHRPAFDWSNVVLHLLLPLAGVLAALLIGALMLVILKANPIAAYAGAG